MAKQKGLSRYGKEIVLIITFKILFLMVLWYCCFSPSHRVHVSAEDMAQQLIQ